MARQASPKITSPATDALSQFHRCTQTWFTEAFASPTGAQQKAWPAIAAGESTLLLAPTGSGKTLAAFLASIDRLMFSSQGGKASPPPATKKGRKKAAEPASTGVRVLYISPLKALGVDVDRNLRSPLAGMSAVANRLEEPFHMPTVGVRSGDTPAKDRRELVTHPPDILITTPESLYLMLTSKASEILRTVETVIIDEIHVMVPTKRGVHLFLTLERLERLRREATPDIRPLQRIGLSATQRPLEEIARLLGGADATADPEVPPVARPVRIVDANEPKRFELLVEVPVEDMSRLGELPSQSKAIDNVEIDSGSSNSAGSLASKIDAQIEAEIAELGGEPLIEGNAAMGPSTPSIWPAIHPRLVELIRGRRSTMIFVNSRRLAERLAAAINELALEEDPEGGEIAMAHHGSVAKDKRMEIEDRLKRGVLPAIVATSSLELGIDMGAVDLVIQIEAPPTIASGIQRIGRAGHQIGAASAGVIFPKFRGDLLACSAATGRMLTAHVEETFYPRNPLDLLAQQIVAIAREPIGVDELYATIRGAAPYADLPRNSFEGLLDLLSGRYPSDEFSELRPRITWDRLNGMIEPRRGTQRIAILNGGTIPDRGLYGVFLAGDGPDGTGGSRVGELDEEMVFETQPGDVFLLGASSWRVVDITRDRVIVVPAPGEPGKMPFWRGDGPGRPLEFGRAIGKLTRELMQATEEDATERLIDKHALEPQAAKNLLTYLNDQREATVELPSDKTIVIESFIDEIGDWRICILSPFGARVHAPWAMAIAARMREEDLGEVDLSWTDDGMIFRLPESANLPAADFFLPKADEIEDLVTGQLGSTALFAARFRENAARALLLPRRQPNRRTPLWLQRRKSADLLAVASRYPSFPILLETYRECLRDVFDLPGLADLLKQIEQRQVRVHQIETSTPSPFANSLLFSYVGNFIYEGDAPLAERRAQALSLDHAQLRELLGSADLRDLLDGETIDEVGLELQRLNKSYVKDADGLHDLLLSLGDLTREELWARVDQASLEHRAFENAVDQLVSQRRVMMVRLAGEERLAAAEDAARLRDAIGTNPPPGLPAAFLEKVANPLDDLVSRYARTHAPFSASDVAQRLGLGEAPVLTSLQSLTDSGRLVVGEFVPGRRGREWCDVSVMRTIKRRSLAKLRKQVEAAPAESLARFLPVWQSVVQPRRGLDGLLDVIEQLQGTPLAASVLEQSILPARVEGYQPSDLDELCVAGEVVWQGVESLGTNDGRVSLYLTDRAPLLCELTLKDSSLIGSPEEDPLPHQIRDLLSERGALFFDEIVRLNGGFANDLLAALWRLVWNGEVTNDTLAPLRSMVHATAASSRSSRGKSSRRASSGRRGRATFRTRRQTRLAGSEGRWNLLQAAQPTEGITNTQRQAAIASQLVERYGIFVRNLAAKEQLAGGFSAVYPVLKAMEESGKIRRGYFVEGLGGAQFAASGADELLRAMPDPDEAQTVVLAATDPANAYGAALPWPRDEEETESTASGRPQRAVGAHVVLSDGRLLGYLGKTLQNLTTFLDDNEPERSRQATELCRALAKIACDKQSLLITKIDGSSSLTAGLREPLLTAGFVATSRGLLHRGEVPPQTLQDRIGRRR